MFLLPGRKNFQNFLNITKLKKGIDFYKIFWYNKYIKRDKEKNFPKSVRKKLEKKS